MKRLFLLFLLVMPLAALAQHFDVSGRVLSHDGKKPVAQAVVELPAAGLWAVADNNGNFHMKDVPGGKAEFAVSCLGFVTAVEVFDISGERDDVNFLLKEDNLALESVVVTAKEVPNAMSTSRTIGGNAINHLQMVNASDISSLLPGGKTVNPDLMQDNMFSLRDGGSSAGNAQFGTAVEIDGVRLSSNASLSGITGVSTRNISSTNIEAVEVVTGIPSAEYGDLGSGMIRVKTRKGKTPYTVVMSTNPRTKQVSASKGFDLGGRGGVLNSNVEYTRATKNPTSPYTSYSRTGLSLNYQNTFADVLRFNVGVAANIGGMDTEDDPDAMVGEWQRVRDNALRANTSLKWQLNRKWITGIDFDASLSYSDNYSRRRYYESSPDGLPAVHAEENGYFIAQMLPGSYYYTTENIDSKRLDYAANLKATWIRSWGDIHSNAKIGVSWRANGNVGRGEYYDDAALSPDGYRPRPYTDIPYMHNIAAYVEESLSLPLGGTTLKIMAGLRAEKTCVKNSDYRNTSSLSPRFNLKYRISRAVSLRAGWGLTEKLPSFAVLYPLPEYRDTRVFSSNYAPGRNVYVYHTQPHRLVYNPELRWQKNRNAEVGVELKLGGTSVSLVGYFNRTKYPFQMNSFYDPFSYKVSGLPSHKPDGSPFVMPSNPLFKVDQQTGEIFVRDADNMGEGWISMETRSTVNTFVKNTRQTNSSPVDRMGLEFVVDFPQINPIRTQLRVDGAYGYTRYVNTDESMYYPSRSTAGGFYPYVGIYVNNGGRTSVTYNGRKTHALDVNLTSTTHIPSIRMVVTLRLEAALLRRSQNLSEYMGREYAINTDQDGNPTGGSVYEGGHYTSIWPIAYLDLEGRRHPFTEADRAKTEFQALRITSSNAYSFDRDGYDPYFSANLSVTKEIGDHVSVSLYANNFTNSRPFVASYATGIKAVFTPEFYYGLTVRVKF